MAKAQIPHGYKQTEVGVVPEDWEVKSVHEIATIKTGPFGTLLKASEYSEGDGVPLISVGEIREGFLKITDQTPRVPDGVIRRLPQYVLKKGDIVFGRKGAVERSALIRQQQEGWFLGSDGISVRPSKDYYGEYLALQFQSARVKGWLVQNAIGTTMPSLNQEILRNVVVPLPPTKAEQEAIAEALSDADALIESLEQLIAKKGRLKQGAMQELLRPKAGWIATKPGRLGAFLKGSGIRKDEALSGDLPCVRYGEIYTKHSDYIKAFYSWISPTVAATARRLKSGDVLFAGSGETKEEIGKCVAFVDDIEAYAGGDIVIPRPEKENSMFLGYYLNTAPINRQKASKGQGDAVVHISSAALADIDLTIPSIEEQTAIAAILTDMDAEIAALKEKLAKARQIKQGMMQELLTGRIRLV